MYFVNKLSYKNCKIKDKDDHFSRLFGHKIKHRVAKQVLAMVCAFRGVDFPFKVYSSFTRLSTSAGTIFIFSFNLPDLATAAMIEVVDTNPGNKYLKLYCVLP